MTYNPSTPISYLKLAGVTAVIGAVAAGAASFGVPRRYVSTAVLRVASPASDQPWIANYSSARLLQLSEEHLLSRASLMEIIQRPSLDLYREERRLMPMEDVIQHMRRDLHIESAATGAASANSFRLTFEYADPEKARAAVQYMAERLRSGDAVAAQRPAPRDPTFDPATRIEILNPANLPARSSAPNRLQFAGIGLGAGLLLGVVIAFLRRRRPAWTLRVLSCTIVGVAAAVAVVVWLPVEYEPALTVLMAGLASLTAGVWMARKYDPPTIGRYGKYALSTAVAAALIAGAISLVFPDHYLSTAVMRIYPLGTQGTDPGTGERLRNLCADALSRSSLAEMIQRPALSLYRPERSRHPMEQVVQRMRADLRIQPVDLPLNHGGDAPLAFSIAFEYTDRFKAQAVAREFVGKLMEQNVMLERELNRSSDPGSIVLEMVDPPSDPITPQSPNRFAIAGLAFAAGLPLGLILAWTTLPTVRPAPYIKMALGGAAAGAVLALAISFSIPNRYVSSATVRVHPPADSGPAGAKAVARTAEFLQQRVQDLVRAETLTEIARRPAIDLYPAERDRPNTELVRIMRERDMRLQSVDVLPASGRTVSLQISFEHTDPLKARLAVMAIVDKLIETRNTPFDYQTDLTSREAGAPLEVSDGATLPEKPSMPNRLNIAGVGLVGGLCLGPVAMLLLRRRMPAPESPA